MNNFERAAEQVKKQYGDVSIEQYVFGFVKSFLLVTSGSRHTPFRVVEFDNICTIKSGRQFDSRVETHKDLSARWLAQFK